MASGKHKPTKKRAKSHGKGPAASSARRRPKAKAKKIDTSAPKYRHAWLMALKFDGERHHMGAPNALNPPDPRAFTVECLAKLTKSGDDPTIVCQPLGTAWRAQQIAWRLGYHAGAGRPEFQIATVDSGLVTARARAAVEPDVWVHLAGVYDGNAVRLFVDGKLAAQKRASGPIKASQVPMALGTRSTTDTGGFFGGDLHVIQFWASARTAEEIQASAARRLLAPGPDDCMAMFSPLDTPNYAYARRLAELGFDDHERAFAQFLQAYLGVVRNTAASTHVLVAWSVADGWVVLHEPVPPAYLPDATPTGGILLLKQKELTVSQILQDVTGNRLKLVAPDGSVAADSPHASETTLAPQWQGDTPKPPRMFIEPPLNRPAASRMHILAPTGPAQSPSTRVFTWDSVDIWLGEPGLSVLDFGYVEELAAADITLHELFRRLHSTSRRTVIDELLAALRAFEALIDRPDVEEVRDVLPFLADPRHWFIIDPTCKTVWPEKKLGNDWQVDFVVQHHREHFYTVVEVESPKKPAYTRSDPPQPSHEHTHAEQQVRDYCNYVDTNRDYIERAEKLPGIRMPEGLVVIGRRRDLTPEAARALRERNQENSRYKTFTFDDLLDRARGLVARARAALPTVT